MTTHTMRIPQTDPKANYVAHKNEIDRAIARVLDSGWYILGQEVTAFEKEFATYIGAAYAVGTGSGTDALTLALRACDIGPGDEVITVSHTAVATVAAIELCGAEPVLVDIDLDTYTIDPHAVASAVTARTRAVVPVHLYGHPADMSAIRKLADHHGLYAIEDCAQSHGASLAGSLTGTWGNIAAFSFYPTKNLAALGDAGMVVTDDAALADRLRMLRQYGWRERYISEIPGDNSRLDELQAAILRTKLQYLDADNTRRRAIAERYLTALKGSSLVLPSERREAKHVYHQFVVRTRHRDSLRTYLKDQGIGALVHYPKAVHQQQAYRGRVTTAASLAVTEQVVDEVLSLPMYPEMSDEQVEYVCRVCCCWKAR